jgi:hypothetical protein
VVTLNRAAPGAPYDDEDVEFAEAMARCLQHALCRSNAYRKGWDRRRDLVGRVERRLRGDEPFTADDLLGDGRFAEIVSDCDGVMTMNDAAQQLVDGETSLLFELVTDRLDRGDLEYHDEELGLNVRGGGGRRFIVHRALVRDDGDRKRVLVVVAHEAPPPL